jgi:hypothetical protein
MFAIDVAIKAHQNAEANAVLAFAVRNILATSSIPPYLRAGFITGSHPAWQPVTVLSRWIY